METGIVDERRRSSGFGRRLAHSAGERFVNQGSSLKPEPVAGGGSVDSCRGQFDSPFFKRQAIGTIWIRFVWAFAIVRSVHLGALPFLSSMVLSPFHLAFYVMGAGGAFVRLSMGLRIVEVPESRFLSMGGRSVLCRALRSVSRFSKISMM